MGTFFAPAVSSILRLSLTHTHTHTHTRTHTRTHTHMRARARTLAGINWWNGPLTLVVLFFALCLLEVSPESLVVLAILLALYSLWHVHTHIPSREWALFFPHTASSIFRLSLTRFVRLSGGPCRCLTSRSRWGLECFIHDCFAVELTGECLKCLFRLTRGSLTLVV